MAAKLTARVKREVSRPNGLDLIDRKILSALHLDGRLSISQLAEQVGLSTSPCWARVKRLQPGGARPA